MIHLGGKFRNQSRLPASQKPVASILTFSKTEDKRQVKRPTQQKTWPCLELLSAESPQQHLAGLSYGQPPPNRLELHGLSVSTLATRAPLHQVSFSTSFLCWLSGTSHFFLAVKNKRFSSAPDLVSWLLFKGWPTRLQWFVHLHSLYLVGTIHLSFFRSHQWTFQFQATAHNPYRRMMHVLLSCSGPFSFRPEPPCGADSLPLSCQPRRCMLAERWASPSLMMRIHPKHYNQNSLPDRTLGAIIDHM